MIPTTKGIIAFRNGQFRWVQPSERPVAIGIAGKQPPLNGWDEPISLSNWADQMAVRVQGIARPLSRRPVDECSLHRELAHFKCHVCAVGEPREEPQELR